MHRAQAHLGRGAGESLTADSVGEYCVDGHSYSADKAAALYDGDYFPPESLRHPRSFQAGHQGPAHHCGGGAGFRSLNVAFRIDLDLYACTIRPVKRYPGARPARCAGPTSGGCGSLSVSKHRRTSYGGRGVQGRDSRGGQG